MAIEQLISTDHHKSALSTDEMTDKVLEALGKTYKNFVIVDQMGQWRISIALISTYKD